MPTSRGRLFEIVDRIKVTELGRQGSKMVADPKTFVTFETLSGIQWCRLRRLWRA